MNDKDIIISIIKNNGSCYIVHPETCSTCPLYAPCIKLLNHRDFLGGKYKAAIDFFFKKYGNKEDLVEILI